MKTYSNPILPMLLLPLLGKLAQQYPLSEEPLRLRKGFVCVKGDVHRDGRGHRRA